MPSPPPGWETWEAIMDIALAEARKAQSRGEVPVGAVVIAPCGAIAGRGSNASIRDRDPSAHAEMVALRAAARAMDNYRLAGAYLAVTLEPCLMCTGAIVHARIRGVIYGATDSAAGCVESQMDGFELPHLNHRPWFAGNVRGDECAALLRDFFAEKRPG